MPPRGGLSPFPPTLGFLQLRSRRSPNAFWRTRLHPDPACRRSRQTACSRATRTRYGERAYTRIQPVGAVARLRVAFGSGALLVWREMSAEPIPCGEMDVRHRSKWSLFSLSAQFRMPEIARHLSKWAQSRSCGPSDVLCSWLINDPG